MAWYDELNQGTFQGASQPARPQPGSIDELRAELAAQQQQQKPKNKGNFLTSLIPTGGGIAGAAGGAAIGTALLPGAGTLVGALLGGAFGGGAGKVAENAVIGEEDLGKGVAQEALLSGVLGAGPIRLAKAGIDTARGVKAGASLTDAVTQAGTKAVDSSARRAVGEKLTNASNDLVIKNFRLTPSQLNNYKAKYGEDASQTIKNYKLVGKDADTIAESAIKPLQGEFDTIAKQIPTLPTADVLKAFKSKYQPLINSAVEDKKAIGQQLKQQADILAKKYGAEIPSSELTALRQEFDSLVNYTAQAANPARYGVNKLSADAIRTSLQQTADKAGLKATNGMTFKEVGKELSKLRELTGNIAKQEQVGRGGLPIGLGNTPGAVIGSAGGVPGAIVGTAFNAAGNSPTGRKLIASGAEKLGTRLTEGATQRNPYSVGSVAGRIAPLGVAGALVQPSLVNSASTAESASTPTAMPSNSSIDGLYNTSGEMSIPESQNPYPQENLMYDLQRDPANADKYIAYFSALQKAFPENKKAPLTSGQATRAAAAQNALRDIPLIADAIQSGKLGATKAIPGADTGLGRRILGTENLDAALFNIADNILRARSGAAAPEAEVKRFVNTFLPGPLDSNEAKRAKLERAVRELQGFVNPQEASAGTLEEVLVAQQQGGF